MIFKTRKHFKTDWKYFVAIVNGFKHELIPLVDAFDQLHFSKSHPMYLVHCKSGS